MGLDVRYNRCSGESDSTSAPGRSRRGGLRDGLNSAPPAPLQVRSGGPCVERMSREPATRASCYSEIKSRRAARVSASVE